MSDRPGDTSREPPPAGVRSTPGPPPPPASPVPVRDLMKPARADATTADSGAEGSDAAVEDREFEREGERWIARVAGEGVYGTGRAGGARLTALHFLRAADPDRPVREALVASGAVPTLGPEELRALCDRATPIADPR